MQKLLLLALALQPLTAHAQDIWATPDHQKASPGTVAANQAAAGPTLSESSTYQGRVLAGLRQVVLRDFEAAIATLRAAAQAEPNAPSAYCALGDAQLEKGDVTEARAAYESCSRFASTAGDERQASIALVGLARATERSQVSVRDKRDAWKRAAQTVTDPLAKSLAEGRLATFEEAVTREADAEPVRQRIALRASQKTSG